MRLTADSNGNSRYFSAKLGWKEKFDPQEIEILYTEAVPMLISPTAIQGKNNRIIRYDISQYSTLAFYLTCILSKEQFAELLLSIIDVFRRMQRVYLNHKNLVLELDKVYIRMNDRSVHFIYLPLADSRRSGDIPGFFRQILLKTPRTTYEQSSFLDACRDWVNRPGSFILEEFDGFIRSNLYAGDRPITPQPESLEHLSVRPDPHAHLSASHSTGSRSGVSSYVTGIVEATRQGTQTEGNTIPLALASEKAEAISTFFLLREKTGEKIPLNRSAFLVGRAAESSYCITGNPAISHCHAMFTIEGSVCSVMDQRSKNGTFVNGVPIPANTAQVLRHGDSIRLADEEFQLLQEES